MKRLLLLLAFAVPALAQTNVQKGAGNVLSNGNIVVGNSTSITATGSGVINATGIPTISINPTAPLTGGGALTGNVTLGITQSSGSTNGYLSSADWTTFNTKQPAGNYITALTGDGTAAGPGSSALTLASVNANPGTSGSNTQSLTIMSDAKGRILALTAQTVTPALGSITGLGTNVATFLATPSLANLNGAVTGDVVVGRATMDTLTNKSMSGSSNTFTNIPNSALTNNSITIGSTNIALGATVPTITGLATPTQATDAATKSYVDAAVYGLDWKASVRAATTANITLSGTQTIDGVTLIAGDRVLVWKQTDATTNGLYAVASGAWSRTPDATTGTISTGLTTFVSEGTLYGKCAFTLTTPDPITIGSTSLTFVQITGPNLYTAGTGINITGNQISTANIPNASLVNSSLTIAGHTVALGGTQTLAASDLTNGVTGTGSVVLAGSPVITGHPTFEGVTSTGATGTGNLVYSISPTLTGSPLVGGVTFSSNTATSLNSITAASATDLVLNGGSSGASVTLRQGSGNIVLFGDSQASATSAVGAVQIRNNGTTNGVRVGTYNDTLTAQGWIAFDRAGGSVSAPTAIKNGMVFGSIFSVGYDGAVWPHGAQIDLIATQDWTGSARGTKLLFSTMPNGSVNNVPALLLDSSGTATFYSSVTANTFLSPAGSNALFGTGSFGTALTLTSATGAALFASSVTATGTISSTNSGTNSFSGPISASYPESNSVGSYAMSFSSGYNGIRQDTTHALNFDVFNGGSAYAALVLKNTGDFSVKSTTASTSTTTGAFQVAGGAGIGGALNVGSGGTFGGVVTLSSASPSLIIGDGTGSPALQIKRVNTSGANPLYFTTAGTNNWYIGQGASGTTNDLQIYNYTAANLALNIAASNSAITIAGNLTVSGTQGLTLSTTGSLNALAATGANHIANTTWGACSQGFGTTADWTVFNKATVEVMHVPTGTQNLVLEGNLTVSGTGTSSFAGPVRLPNYVVSGLPSASTSGAGAMAYVTDSTATAITGLGLAVVGGGSNKVVVVSDGTNWIVQ